VIGFEASNYFGYCNFPRLEFKFELNFREGKVLLKSSRIKLKYLEVLKKYKTWPNFLSLNVVACKNICRVYCCGRF
jgi:hypothetical protein